MHLLKCLLSITVALLSCGAYATAFEDLDRACVQQSPYLQHLGVALNADQCLEARDLVNSKLDFRTAPDPTALLKQMQKLNSNTLSKPVKSLRLMSYNVALLEAKALGLATVMSSPYLNERRERLPEAIFATQADVIFLQEVWVGSVRFFEDEAEKHGYTSFSTNKKNYDDGLMLLVRNDFMNDSKTLSVRAIRYETQSYIETYGTLSVARGMIKVSLEHEKLGRLHLYNTHLLSFRGNWLDRINQTRELGKNIVESTPEDDLVFVGGDMNAGPYYRDDHWVGYLGYQAQDWWRNAVAYPALLHYGRLNDLMVMGLSEEDADLDVRYGNAVFNKLNKAKDSPGSMADWCKAIPPHRVFTATDCNSLHTAQYPEYEQPARQDHLFVHDTLGRIKVRDRKILFTEQIRISDAITTELSDHYGVMVDVDIGAEKC